jgi:CTP-dependent riboflavin kinase
VIQKLPKQEQKIRKAPNEEVRRFEERERNKLIEEKATQGGKLAEFRALNRNQLAQIRESIKHFLEDKTILVRDYVICF